MSIFKIQSFDNKDGAKNFANTWGSNIIHSSPGLVSTNDINSMSLPLTIVIVKFSGVEDVIVYIPVVCSNGNLGTISSMALKI